MIFCISQSASQIVALVFQVCIPTTKIATYYILLDFHCSFSTSMAGGIDMDGARAFSYTRTANHYLDCQLYTRVHFELRSFAFCSLSLGAPLEKYQSYGTAIEVV